jgi:hypothetical protein
LTDAYVIIELNKLEVGKLALALVFVLGGGITSVNYTIIVLDPVNPANDVIVNVLSFPVQLIGRVESANPYTVQVDYVGSQSLSIMSTILPPSGIPF